LPLAKNNNIGAHLALLAVALIYSANYLIAKWVMPNPIGPNAFIVLRVTGALALFLLVSFKFLELPKLRDLPIFLFCGLTGVATNQLFFFNGLSLTTPVNASIIMCTNPILVAILYFIGKKKFPSILTTTGILLGSIGALGIILLRAPFEASAEYLKGDLFILINSLSYGLYLVTAPRLMKKYKPITVVTWVFACGLLFILPIGYSDASAIPWETLTPLHWMSLAFIVVAVTFLTYLLNIYALSKVSPTVTSAYIYLQPLLAGVFAFLFAGIGNQDHTGSITFEKILFALLIFAGVYLVGKRND
jgi:drug/metabolite transporter (DMT)-like permease